VWGQQGQQIKLELQNGNFLTFLVQITKYVPVKVMQSLLPLHRLCLLAVAMRYGEIPRQ